MILLRTLHIGDTTIETYQKTDTYLTMTYINDVLQLVSEYTESEFRIKFGDDFLNEYSEENGESEALVKIRNKYQYLNIEDISEVIIKEISKLDNSEKSKLTLLSNIISNPLIDVKNTTIDEILRVYGLLVKCGIVNTITPLMNKRTKELRMMGFVPYNISDIQKGIQFGHAVTEYSINESSEHIRLYSDFANNYKTYIILNGGTTNNENGSLNSILKELEGLSMPLSTFHEPDLNNALTAVVFIADEKLFDHYHYPLMDKYVDDRMNEFNYLFSDVNPTINTIMEIKFKKEYLKIIGGEQRYAVKKMLKNAKLA